MGKEKDAALVVISCTDYRFARYGGLLLDNHLALGNLFNLQQILKLSQTILMALTESSMSGSQDSACSSIDHKWWSAAIKINGSTECHRRPGPRGAKNSRLDGNLLWTWWHHGVCAMCHESSLKLRKQKIKKTIYKLLWPFKEAHKLNAWQDVAQDVDGTWSHYRVWNGSIETV